MRYPTYFLLLLIALTLPDVAQADDPIDWPTFQANTQRTGASNYPAIKSPEIAWSTQLGIMGYLNCPVIDGDRVFVTSSGNTHNQPDERDGVYALDLNTGEVLWHRPTDADACGISINRQHVYVGDDGGTFQAIDRQTGEPKWSHTFEASVFAQPAVVGGWVVVADSGGKVIAFDAESGEPRWEKQHHAGVRGGVAADNNRLYVAFLNGTVWCLTWDGEKVWEQNARLDNNFTELYPAPTLHDGRLYLGYARNTSYNTPALSCLDAASGAVIWDSRTLGLRLRGERHTASGANIRSSAAVYGNRLVLGGAYSNHLLQYDRSTGRFGAKTELGAKMFPHWPSPVIANKVAYLGRHDGGLYAVDLTTNSMIWMLYLGDHPQAGRNNLPPDILPPNSFGSEWEPNVGKPIFATPALARDGRMVLGTGDGWLYCIRERP